MSYDRKTKFSKNHKNPSFPKLVPGVLPFRLEGREPQNRKIEKIQIFRNFSKIRFFGLGLGFHRPRPHPGRRHLGQRPITILPNALGLGFGLAPGLGLGA